VLDNDFGGDPDGLFALVHLALSPSVQLEAVVASAHNPFFGESMDQMLAASKTKARHYLNLVERGDVPVYVAPDSTQHAQVGIAESDGVRAILQAANATDGGSPLFVACGGGLSTIASAWLIDPSIANKLTVLWIGGPEHEGLAVPPPNAPSLEYNLAIDQAAARVVFNESDLKIIQIPRDSYRSMLISMAELSARLAETKLGRELFAEVEALRSLALDAGIEIGETYVLGDSPLVTLTALTTAFEPGAASSEMNSIPCPKLNDEGNYLPNPGGRQLSVMGKLDHRLTFEDMFVKFLGFEAAGTTT
jgi:inosine-uridine nucleoside N-ribohydrolase